jgi:DNA-damage-inducible protein J
MTQVIIPLEDDLRNRAEALFEELGMSINTAFNVFVRQALRCNGLPFEVTADPFYSPANIAYLEKAYNDVKAGRGLTEHELFEVDDD